MTLDSAPFAIGDRVTFNGTWIGTVKELWQETFPARPREYQWVVKMRSMTDADFTTMRAEHLRLATPEESARG